MDYKQAGVDIEEAYRAVARYRESAAATLRPGVIQGIGGFAGLFSLKEWVSGAQAMEEPVLVSGTDGVGTKLELAFHLKQYATLGIDCVAMCVNDILCHGARPLYFLDYLACGKLDAAIAAQIVEGVAVGCRETGSVLLGGETAEMPGFYAAGKYDIAGFALGIVDRKRLVDGSAIQEGDALIGIASSGVHSNGFSLIRQVLPDWAEDCGGMPIGQVLLEPTRLYVKPVLGLLEHRVIRGMAHITGGGFYENIPRMFSHPADHEPWWSALIQEGSWEIPRIFPRIAYGMVGGPLRGAAAAEAGAALLKTDGNLKQSMFATFNMGIGFVLAVAPEDAPQAIEYLDSRGYPAWEIGRVAARAGRNGGVCFV
ncbi:MAG: phosphoribosylformylglycinamidine cyclo-ligase [Treponema sp.]|jgi:phosphoribosylformylglycinamidine cyclo-ligase|nr:phosphoribosylformylglycinamidine cyclo-ligase [Treponema sp.]